MRMRSGFHFIGKKGTRDRTKWTRNFSALYLVGYLRMDAEISVLSNITMMSKYDVPIMEQNITTAQTVYRSSIVCIGIFLNCVVLIVVSLSRQLHYPRHIFWAAVSICECVLLFDCGIELVAVHNRDYLACLFVVLLYPSDYSVLLICLALAAFDRYISIVRYEWYN